MSATKLDLSLPVAPEHHHVFHCSSGSFSCELREFETAGASEPGIDTGIAHFQSIALGWLEVKRCRRGSTFNYKTTGVIPLYACVAFGGFGRTSVLTREFR